MPSRCEPKFLLLPRGFLQCEVVCNYKMCALILRRLQGLCADDWRERLEIRLANRVCIEEVERKGLRLWVGEVG